MYNFSEFTNRNAQKYTVVPMPSSRIITLTGDQEVIWEVKSIINLASSAGQSAMDDLKHSGA